MKNKIDTSEIFRVSMTAKEAGFAVPKDFFSTAEERYSSFLVTNKLSNEPGYTVPENYFPRVESLIIKEITFKKEVKANSLRQNIFKISTFSAAASIVLFLGMYFFGAQPSNELSFDAIGQSDIENWMEEHANDISNQAYLELLPNAIITASDFDFTDIKNDAIEAYIINSEDMYLLNDLY